MTIDQLRQQAGLVLDTNLLLLYCVGQSDPHMISKFTTRLSRYDVDDYRLLVQFIALFKKLVTTANILTETVNLIDKKSGRYDGVLRQIIIETLGMDELAMSSQILVTKYARQFLTFGLTDLVLCELAQQSYLVLTDDGAISAFIAGNQGTALNFEQLRNLLIQKRSFRHKR